MPKSNGVVETAVFKLSSTKECHEGEGCNYISSNRVRQITETLAGKTDLPDGMFNYGQLQVTFNDGSVGWYDAIRNDVDLTSHLDAAIQSMRIVAAAVESFRTGKTIEL